MTTRGRELAVRGCLKWSIDHHHACCAAYAEQLRRRGRNQPIYPGQQPQMSD